jgi:hypothetical protein
MNARLVHIAAAAAMAVLVAAFELGALSPRDAFFGVLAVLVSFTAYKFLNYDGRPLGEAAQAIFTRPAGKGERVLGYFTYVGVAAVGLLVALQAVTSV